MSTKLNYSVIVMTSDKYSKVLKDFKFFFLRFWPKSYQDLIVVLEFDSIEDEEFIHITSKSNDWSERLNIALNHISSEYVVILLDDYFILNEVDNSELQSLLDFMKLYSIDYLSWTADTDNYPLKLESKYGQSNKIFYKAKSTIFNYKYLVNAHGIYNTKSLKKLLRKNENPWQFETNASLRAHINNNFKSYRVNGKISPFRHFKGGVLVKGMLSNEAESLFKEMDFTPSFNTIDIIGGNESCYFFRKITSLKSKISTYLNVITGKF